MAQYGGDILSVLEAVFYLVAVGYGEPAVEFVLIDGQELYCLDEIVAQPAVEPLLDAFYFLLVFLGE